MNARSLVRKPPAGWLLLIATALLCLAAPAWAERWTTVYSHPGPLTNYTLTLEANPGVKGPYPTKPDLGDVGMKTVNGPAGAYTAVTANTKHRNIYANALAFYKMIGKTPDGKPISLATYRYTLAIRLPRVPVAKMAPYNAQNVEMSLQFWDGSATLWPSDKRQVEATVYWNLNPWDKTFGEILVYTAAPGGGLRLYDTGIRLRPDTKWHVFSLGADLRRQVWTDIAIDGRSRPLTGLPLLLRRHSDWGGGVSIALTAESMNCYPGPQAAYVNSWTTDFKDASLARAQP